MIRNMNVQDNMRKEINNAIGSTRFPSMEDKPNLPYCQAVIQEVLRKGTVLPLALFHGLTADLKCKGFIIPKDAVLIPNLHSASFDEDIFPDPQDFRPERFLDEKGNLQITDKVLALSLGKQILQC
jgi:cytochrome P450